MPLTNIKQSFQALEQGWCLLHCTLVVGDTGAVTSVSGKGFNSGAPSGELGGIVHTSEGLYTITLPGTGALTEIVPLTPTIIDGSATDVKHTLCTARTLSTRVVAWTFLDADTPAVTDPASGAIVEFLFLVRDTSVT